MNRIYGYNNNDEDYNNNLDHYELVGLLIKSPLLLFIGEPMIIIIIIATKIS